MSLARLYVLTFHNQVDPFAATCPYLFSLCISRSLSVHLPSCKDVFHAWHGQQTLLVVSWFYRGGYILCLPLLILFRSSSLPSMRLWAFFLWTTSQLLWSVSLVSLSYIRIGCTQHRKITFSAPTHTHTHTPPLPPTLKKRILRVDWQWMKSKYEYSLRNVKIHFFLTQSRKVILLNLGVFFYYYFWLRMSPSSSQGIMFFHFLWVGPLQCLVALVYLWYRLGPQLLAAMAVVLLLMPTQLLMGKLFSRLRWQGERAAVGKKKKQWEGEGAERNFKRVRTWKKFGIDKGREGRVKQNNITNKKRRRYVRKLR